MGNTDRGAAAGKTALPLAQTVFLPKTAMGVRYIENIRTTVYAERVVQHQRGRWLRGFYQIDLEYGGLEGRGLYKHRVMLPMKVELPAGWMPGVSCDVSDMHIAIGTPRVQILSPYVLEFSGNLMLEYIGGENGAEQQPRPAKRPGGRHWISEIPPVVQDEAAKRLESKIDRMFFREMGEGGVCQDMPENDCPREKNAAEDGAFRLPVWRRGRHRPQPKLAGGAALGADMAAEDDSSTCERQDALRLQSDNKCDNKCESKWQDKLGNKWEDKSENKHRSIFSRLRAGEIADFYRHEVSMQAAAQAADVVADDAMSDTDCGYASRLPVWRRRGDAVELAGKMAAPSGVASLRDKILGRIEQDNDYAADGVFSTRRPAARPRADEKLPAQDTDKSRLRSMLTAAAIARLQAQGEKLLTVEPVPKKRSAESVDAAPTVQRADVAADENITPAGGRDGRQGSFNSAADYASAASEENPAELPVVEYVAVAADNGVKNLELQTVRQDARQVIVREIVEQKADNSGLASRETADREVIDAAVSEDRSEYKSENKSEYKSEYEGENVQEAAKEVVIETVGENINDYVGQQAAKEETAAASPEPKAVAVMADESAEVAEVAESAEVTESTAVINDTAAEDTAIPAAAEVMTDKNSAKAVLEEAEEAHTEAAQESTAVGQSAADDLAQVRLVNTNGVRLRMNTAARPGMAMPSMGGKDAKSGKCSLKYYVVKPGDDPMGIALKHNVSLDCLRAGNNLPDGELTAGMVLRIPC